MTEDDQQEIEQEFAASWDQVERFFELQSVREWLKSAPNLITELRKRGHDRQFRAGTSLWTFIVSRSRKHGLRDQQPRLAIGWDQVGGMIVNYHEPPNVHIQFKHEQIEITAELEDLLKRLAAQPID